MIFRVFTVLFLAMSVIGSANAGYVGNDPINLVDPTGQMGEEPFADAAANAARILYTERHYQIQLEKASNSNERSKVANRFANWYAKEGSSRQARQVIEEDIASRPRTLMDPNGIKPTQNGYSRNFADGGTVDQLRDDLIAGKDPNTVQPIRVFTDENGDIRTVDHRRMVAAQEAGAQVSTVPLTKFEKEQDSAAGQRARNGRFDNMRRNSPRSRRRGR